MTTLLILGTIPGMFVRGNIGKTCRRVVTIVSSVSIGFGLFAGSAVMRYAYNQTDENKPMKERIMDPAFTNIAKEIPETIFGFSKGFLIQPFLFSILVDYVYFNINWWPSSIKLFIQDKEKEDRNGVVEMKIGSSTYESLYSLSTIDPFSLSSYRKDE